MKYSKFSHNTSLELNEDNPIKSKIGVVNFKLNPPVILKTESMISN
jgi:hypothetical protein